MMKQNSYDEAIGRLAKAMAGIQEDWIDDRVTGPTAAVVVRSGVVIDGRPHDAVATVDVVEGDLVMLRLQTLGAAVEVELTYDDLAAIRALQVAQGGQEKGRGGECDDG